MAQPMRASIVFESSSRRWWQRRLASTPAYARILGLFAALGFAASLAVYLYTYTGDSVSRQFPPIWLLHVGIFVVFAPAAVIVAREQKAGSLFDLLSSYPKWVIAAAVVLQLSMPIIGLPAFTSLEGSPEETTTGYVLNNHGKMRVLSREQYLAAKALEDRGFSAIWLDFYGISALFWLGRRVAIIVPPLAPARPPRR